jgi:hypothetical protein
MNNKILLLAILMIIINGISLLSGCTDIQSNENTNEGPAWMNNYVPVHTLGEGSNDFWFTFPPDNPSDGLSVDHLDWVIYSLQEGCVLFVVHKTGCVSCQAQADRVIDLGDKFEGQLMFYDLDIPLGGDIEKKAYDSYLYDPDGPPGYIALTGIITLVKDDDEIKYGWHSWEGKMGFITGIKTVVNFYEIYY